MIEFNEIIEAVEYKEHFVLDEIARQGAFLRNASGNLLRYVGGFTVVFPFETNGEKWAFRCWFNTIDADNNRFEKISEAISQSKAKYLCDFVYVENGILINGQQYPTTRMRWVDGQTIKDYICQNATNKRKMNALAQNFLRMTKDMHNHHMAHGDLQHGNIMVDNQGELFLVDYDSFYCPALSGEKDIITGLPPYQHPSRASNKIANEKLDYFSELIIYLSILAIAENPSLADKYQLADTEQMLFSVNDFENLKSSNIYADLQSLSSDIQALLYILEIYLSTPNLIDLEPFDEMLAKMGKTPIIHSFKSSRTSILNGDKVKLSWQAENFTQILLNGSDVTSLTEKVIEVNNEKEFVLEVINYKQHTSQKLTLSVLPVPQITFTASKQKLHANRSEEVELTWQVENAQKCTLFADGVVLKDNCSNKETIKLSPDKSTTYTLRVEALDESQTHQSKELIVEVWPDAEVSFKTDKQYVFPTIPFTLSWDVQNAQKVELEQKEVESIGTQIFDKGIEKNTTFTLRVTDAFGVNNYPITINILPIPQVKSILVPTPTINRNLSITIKQPRFSVAASLPKVDIEMVKCNIPKVRSLTELGLNIDLIQDKKPKFSLRRSFINIYKQIKELI